MPLPLPVSLSPSKVSSLTDCALAFRFSAAQGLCSGQDATRAERAASAA